MVQENITHTRVQAIVYLLAQDRNFERQCNRVLELKNIETLCPILLGVGVINLNNFYFVKLKEW